MTLRYKVYNQKDYFFELKNFDMIHNPRYHEKKLEIKESRHWNMHLFLKAFIN